MAAAAIHVVPDDNFDDWVVRDHDGHEFGHYPTREVAERAAEAITRERGTNSSFISLTEEPAARILRRGGGQTVPAMIKRKRAMPCHTLTPSACSRVYASS
jgi:hypothetical protein